MKYPPRNMSEALNLLLGDVCAKLGFCSMSMEAREELSRRESLTATQFAEAVLAGEGMSPIYSQHKKALVAEFVRRFGSGCLRASDFG